MEAYNAALATNPDLHEVRASLGDLWRLQGPAGRPAALACYAEALRRCPGCATAWRGLGDAHREGADAAAAVACYREALRLQPGNADAHTGLGVALREGGHPAEAEASFRAVVTLRPRCPLALGNLAGMCYDQVRAPAGGRVATARMCGLPRLMHRGPQPPTPSTPFWTVEGPAL